MPDQVMHHERATPPVGYTIETARAEAITFAAGKGGAGFRLRSAALIPPATTPPPPETGAPAPRSFIAATWAKFGLAGPLAVAALAMPPLGGFLLIGYMKTIADYLRSHQDNGPPIYSGVFAVLAGLALLPTYAQSALGGFAFGLKIGVPAALAGFVGGSIIGYEIARRASGERVMQTIESRPQWKAVREAFVSGRIGGGFFKTLGIVALLRLPPNSPFAISNLVMASVRVPRVPYILGTLIGMAPRTTAAVWVGTRVQQLTSKSDLSDATPVWLVGIGVAVMLIVLGVVGAIASRAIKRVTGSPAVGDSDQ